MLDTKFIKENTPEIEKMLQKRGVNVDIVRLIELNDERLELIQKIELIRAERNKLSKERTHKNIKRGREIKIELKNLEPTLETLKVQILDLQLSIPNMLHPDVPKGKDESENVEIRRWGKIPEFDFEAKDHVQLGTALGLFEIPRAAKITGTGYYFLTGDAVALEFSLIRYALALLTKEGFYPMITPELVRKRYAEGTGYIPKREEPDIYKLENENLYLIATAEIPLAAYHADEILKEEELPKRYAGFSSCFRKEAGAYGKHTKGIFRVHQFDKVEMFTFVKPAGSMDTFHYLINLSERLFQGLEIPYRVMNICTGDMNAAGFIKYDIDYYSPYGKTFREFTSGTNTTDYQARRLNIRYKKKGGEAKFVHTLNNTAIAIGRTIIAILENYQQKDGSVKIPEVLQDYVGKSIITPQN